MKRLLPSLLAVLIAGSAQAYECSFDNIVSTAPTEKFLDNQDGTVTDLRFGLMWSVCTFGQTYSASDKSCKGDGTEISTWSTSLQLQDNINEDGYLGFQDWRLPNIKELHSIVERACMNPAINADVFPDSLNAVYWSNTPDNEVNPSLLGRVVDFSDGTEFFKATSRKRYVRLVRSIDN